MPGRLRNAPASEGTGNEDTTTATGQSRLKFKDPLTWRAGRAIPVAQLHKSLDKLANELKQFHQDELEPSDVAAIAHNLAGSHLLAHKDRGVRAKTAVCIVDILMLTAPDAPFSESQLKDIFSTFVLHIIPALADPSNAYNPEHVHVLHSLAEYMSIVLMTDLSNADKLTVSLFTTCFDIMSQSSKKSTGEEIAKKVEYDMTRLLVTVIDESPTLPDEVVDTIIAQFLRIDPRVTSREEQRETKGKKNAPVDEKQDTLLLKEYPRAYNMAKALCISCPEKMTNLIGTYFTNILVDAADHSQNFSEKLGVKRIENADDFGSEVEDFHQLSKAHKLIRELWRACPDVLHNVIPQLETELNAESVPLRLLATQTIGDVTAGIGVAGPPTPIPPNPAAWPPLRLGQQETGTLNPLTTPMAPKPFPHTHIAAYESFLSRRHDRSASVRAAWATAAGRILLTSAGGLGLQRSEEEKLVPGLATMLNDADEKVRRAAVEVIGQFGFTDMVNRLGAYGGISTPGSALANLAERVKDKKNTVREEAFKILGRVWGAAAFEIEVGSDAVQTTLGQIPQHILGAFFTNDAEIQLSIDKTVFECLVPLSFPPIKAEARKTARQRAKQADDSHPETQTDPDQIRLRRILTLYRDLDEKGRKVFSHMMQRQVKMSQIMLAYVKACEDYNGGVIEDGNEADIKGRLTRLVEIMSKTFPDSARASADLWKFAKVLDRRNFQLIKYATAPESEYKTVVNGIKEFTTRVLNGQGTASMMETLGPLLYRCSLLFLNRSHIPAVIQVSRTNDHGLGEAAHEVLKMISTLCPAVLKTQILEMCKHLQDNAPSSSQSEDPNAADTLKACAGFARRFPEEVPKDRRLQIAFTDYALYSASPRAAKHAVTILMCTAEKKEMYAKDLISKAVKDFSMDSPHSLARLATIAQISLLTPTAAEPENEAIADIALNQVLMAESPSENTESTYAWSDEPSSSLIAKDWALRVLVNRLRSSQEESAGTAGDKFINFRDLAAPLFRILNLLITNEGELHKSNTTPATERPRLRLLAAKSILKLCSHKRICEELVTSEMFNSIALLVQDRLLPVRKGFVDQLKRYLNSNRLSARWYTVLFLLAFEPDTTLRSGTSLWLKSQSHYIIRSRSAANANGNQYPQNTIELLFARLLSLLAHHPDYPTEEGSETYTADLLDFSRYILFYLSSVSHEDNLSLIFHVAQRVKQTRDGIAGTPELEDAFSYRLYTLSDLSQAIIRSYAETLSTTKGHEKGVNLLQTFPGKLRLPGHIFKPFAASQREDAVKIAERDFLADLPDIKDEIGEVVRKYMKATGGSKTTSKKRKPQENADDDDDDSDTGAKKKVRKSTTKLPIRKAPKSSSASKQKKRRTEDPNAQSRQPSRKSTRVSGANVSYADFDSSEEDEKMDHDQDEDEDESSDDNDGSSEPEAMDVDDEDSTNEAEDQGDVASDVNETPHSARRGKTNGANTPISTSRSKRTSTVPSSATKPSPSTLATKKPTSRRKATTEPEEEPQDSRASMSAAAKRHQSKLKATTLKSNEDDESVESKSEGTAKSKANGKESEKEMGNGSGSGSKRRGTKLASAVEEEESTTTAPAGDEDEGTPGRGSRILRRRRG